MLSFQNVQVIYHFLMQLNRSFSAYVTRHFSHIRLSGTALAPVAMLSSAYLGQNCWNWVGTQGGRRTLGWAPSHLPCCASMLNTKPPVRCETFGLPGRSDRPVGQIEKLVSIRVSLNTADFAKAANQNTLCLIKTL